MQGCSAFPAPHPGSRTPPGGRKDSRLQPSHRQQLESHGVSTFRSRWPCAPKARTGTSVQHGRSSKTSSGLQRLPKAAKTRELGREETLPRRWICAFVRRTEPESLGQPTRPAFCERGGAGSSAPGHRAGCTGKGRTRAKAGERELRAPKTRPGRRDKPPATSAPMPPAADGTLSRIFSSARIFLFSFFFLSFFFRSN